MDPRDDDEIWDEEADDFVPWIDTRIDLGSQAQPIPNDLRENPISRSVGKLESRAFGPVLAGCGRRAAAKLVDSGLVGALCWFGAAYWIGRLPKEERVAWILFLASFGLLGAWAVWVVYHVVLRGDTVGKRLFRLRVVDERARPIGFGRSLGRVLAESVSAAILGIGYLFAVVDPHKRSLHDHLCGTRVVRRR